MEYSDLVDVLKTLPVDQFRGSVFKAFSNGSLMRLKACIEILTERKQDVDWIIEHSVRVEPARKIVQHLYQKIMKPRSRRNQLKWLLECEIHSNAVTAGYIASEMQLTSVEYHVLGLDFIANILSVFPEIFGPSVFFYNVMRSSVELSKTIVANVPVDKLVQVLKFEDIVIGDREFVMFWLDWLMQDDIRSQKISVKHLLRRSDAWFFSEVVVELVKKGQMLPTVEINDISVMNGELAKRMIQCLMIYIRVIEDSSVASENAHKKRIDDLVNNIPVWCGHAADEAVAKKRKREEDVGCDHPEAS